VNGFERQNIDKRWLVMLCQFRSAGPPRTGRRANLPADAIARHREDEADLVRAMAEQLEALPGGVMLSAYAAAAIRNTLLGALFDAGPDRECLEELPPEARLTKKSDRCARRSS
jgi:hypothetical protein